MFIDSKQLKKIYFIGIGGIGISASARMARDLGCEVLGSDSTQGEIVDELRNEGVKVFTPQSADNIADDIDLVVYTVAASDDNPERKKARELGINEMTYPQFLAELMKGKKGIGISGTNGKTTTTAMLGLIFIKAGLDPSVILGGKVDYLNGNARVGRGEYFIFESDEYRRAFQNYRPQMAVVTYIAADHLDYYRDLAEIISAFNDYLKTVPKDGFIFINADDHNSLKAVENCSAQVITFGIDNPADIKAENIKILSGKQSFNLYFKNKKLGEIILSVPGKFNVYNALSAVGPALMAGVNFAQIKKSLAQFKGSWRRFEKIGFIGQTEIIADYAHTPDAVSKTIRAAKEFYPGKKILAIFQPHQYSRTKKLFNEFTGSFSAADQTIIFDIFYVKGRENPADFDVSGQKLAEAIKARKVNAIYGDEKDFLAEAENFDLALVMGAGDIYFKIKKVLADVNVSNDKDTLALEEKYGDLSDSVDVKKKKIVGHGFSRQYEIAEKNKYYAGQKSKNIKIIDKTKK